MTSAHNQFLDNIARVRDLGLLYGSLVKLTAGKIDLTDLLRAQIVLAVSAFDYLIHELCRTGMIESAKGVRVKTDAYTRYQVSLNSVDQLISGSPEEAWLGNAVRDKHSWLSFQDPDKVADAMRLISLKELWTEVGKILGVTPSDVKRDLKLIVDRRNKIAHESDMDPSTIGGRWPITPVAANDAVDTIEKIGTAVFNVVT